MSELQAGMLALVVGAERCQPNIGKIVTLSHFLKTDERAPNGLMVSKDCWVIIGDGLVIHSNAGGYSDSDFGIASSRFLMPVKPEADPLDVTHKEELHA